MTDAIRKNVNDLADGDILVINFRDGKEIRFRLTLTKEDHPKLTLVSHSDELSKYDSAIDSCLVEETSKVLLKQIIGIIDEKK